MLNVPGEQSVLNPPNVVIFEPEAMKTISSVAPSVIWSSVISLSKLPPFSSTDTPADGAVVNRIVAIPVAIDTGDSVYRRRRVSFFDVLSRATHSNENESRLTPFTDCVMIFVEVGGAIVVFMASEDDVGMMIDVFVVMLGTIVMTLFGIVML